jgi:ribosome-associated protein
MADTDIPEASEDDADATTPEGPSKTQRKKQMLALQDLGEELVELAESRLKAVPLSERVLTAVLAARRITAHGGRKRQLQYIGKLMRDEDDETIAAIRHKLAGFAGEHNEENARFHAIERWRTRLLDKDEALQTFIERFPQAPIQRLRQLVREARKDAQTGKPPSHARELFKLIREIVEDAPAA